MIHFWCSKCLTEVQRGADSTVRRGGGKFGHVGCGGELVVLMHVATPCGFPECTDGDRQCDGCDGQMVHRLVVREQPQVGVPVRDKKR